MQCLQFIRLEYQSLLGPGGPQPGRSDANCHCARLPGFQRRDGKSRLVAQDTTPASASSVTLQTTSVGTVDDNSTVTALAYGIPARNNTGASASPNALLAGVQNGDRGELWF